MKYGQRVLSLIAIAIMVLMTKPSFGAIPPTERTALIALYNSTGGDGWTDNAGWKDGVLEADGFGPIGSEGNWRGVSIFSDQVWQLYLGSNQLSGNIPPELENLVNLGYCQLENNQLTGNIPPELGNLANLKWLYLYGNQLTGSIPPELGDLANLNRLNLSGNQLTGRIPDSLLNLVNLYDGVGLSIASNHLCTDDAAVKAFVDLKAGSGWEDSQTNTGCDLESIPTLNEWGMIVLTCLLIFVSLIMVRKKKDRQIFS